MIHELKILPEHFEAVNSGAKKAEFRKNDRNFRIDDLLKLNEYDKKSNQYTGRFIAARITHITNLADYAAGYVMLSIKEIGDGMNNDAETRLRLAMKKEFIILIKNSLKRLLLIFFMLLFGFLILWLIDLFK